MNAVLVVVVVVAVHSCLSTLQLESIHSLVADQYNITTSSEHYSRPHWLPVRNPSRQKLYRLDIKRVVVVNIF